MVSCRPALKKSFIVVQAVHSSSGRGRSWEAEGVQALESGEPGAHDCGLIHDMIQLWVQATSSTSLPLQGAQSTH